MRTRCDCVIIESVSKCAVNNRRKLVNTIFVLNSLFRKLIDKLMEDGAHTCTAGLRMILSSRESESSKS